MSATTSIDFALPERRAARRAFDRAAARFDDACFVHDETRRRLLERLDFMKLDPRVVVDIGCATARAASDVAARYPAARVLAVDSSVAMLRAARRATAAAPRVAVVGGDAALLPLKDGVAQLAVANLVLPSCRPQTLFAEAARVLEPGGLLLFATLGPDSLQEVRRAWAAVDREIHVHAAFDMHDLGDILMAAGLGDPVVDVDRIEITYPDVAALVRDLRGCGAVNVAGGRRRGLTGARRWSGFEANLRATGAARSDARLAITVELVLGQAWGRGPRRAAGPGAAGEVAIAVDRIGRPGRPHSR